MIMVPFPAPSQRVVESARQVYLVQGPAHDMLITMLMMMLMALMMMPRGEEREREEEEVVYNDQPESDQHFNLPRIQVIKNHTTMRWYEKMIREISLYQIG